MTKSAMTNKTFVQAINAGLHAEMERDERVLLVGLDVGRYGGLFTATQGIYDRFGSDRVFDTPISEAGFTGASIGLAMEGFRPVVEIQFADFATVAFDQITTIAAKMRFLSGGATNVPMVIRMPFGVNVTEGGYMAGAGPHHSQSPEAWFCHCAGLKVVMPSDPADAKGLLQAAIRDDGPVMYFEQKGMYQHVQGEVPDDDCVVPLGVAAVKREGTDLTIVATGMMVEQSLLAAEELAGDGVSVEVVDPRTLVPLDREGICASVRKTGRAIVAHEAPMTGGVGAEIVATIADGAFDALKAPVRRVAGFDSPVPATGDLLQLAIPNAARIVDAARGVLG
ncbi:MAG TPA: alpha-ketoacid dehydrogenase subunit beta [Dehalococcoidia bacterium]|nr:alpha-ketoacid dehydrogenase subunit beta [Dehalococcoidia bacterium]